MNSSLEQKDTVKQVQDSSLAQVQTFTPVSISEIEISQPLPDILSFDDKTGQRYQRALCLIRFHTQPLGTLELHLGEHGLSAGEYVEQIWQRFHPSILEHLREDGLPTIQKMDASGLPYVVTPKCLAERETFLLTAPFVSVIISTRNRPDSLARCLVAVMAQRYPNFEILIIDNAPSTTGTADFIQRVYADEPKIQLLREDRPGQSFGRNCGANAARGEILAFLDDDTVVDSYWLAELVRAFYQVDNVACTTSLILPLELETPSQVWIEEFGGFNKGFKQRVFSLVEGRSDTPLHPYAAGRYGTGASMAFKAAFFRSIGGFDPDLANGKVGGGEDLAAFLQVIRRKQRIVYQPTSILYHQHKREYAGLRRQIYGYGIAIAAFLTKSIFDEPVIFFDILLKVPAGLLFVLNPRSAKNNKKSKQYPRDLTLVERKGLLSGLFIYLSRRWKRHK